MAKVVVIGSANMDTTHQLKGDFPEKFSSESGNEIVSTARVLGGKGFNQARAIKLQNPDADVSFVGCKEGYVFWEKVKEINKTLPKYKYIKGLIVTDVPLIKTTTNTVKSTPV